MKPVLLAVVIVALSLWAALVLWPVNLVALAALDAKFDKAPVPPFSSNSCPTNWLAARTLVSDEAEKAYERALNCDPVYQSMTILARPQDPDLAFYAVQQNPSSPEFWLWLAEVQTPLDRVSAFNAYQATVTLDPSQGLAWCRLGWIFENENQPDQARDAYLNCCTNGDPGVNGCFGAGRMEEKLGNPQAAIAAYRQSKWETALKRAEELARGLDLR